MINKIRKILKNIPAVLYLVRKVKKLSLPKHVKVGNSRVFIGNDLGMRRSYTSPGYFSSFEKIIDKYIKEGDVVIDIGAHVGITTLMMSEKVGIHGEVLSFEPSPNSFFILNQNISNNEIKNVSLFQSAIADKKGVLNFYTNKFHTGFNSLSKSNAEINIGIDNDLQAIEVSTDTLDNIIYSNHKIPKFIKMDVQGAEYTVLIGSLRLLEDKSISDIYIYLEFFPLAIENFSNIDSLDFLIFLEKHHLKILFSEHYNDMIYQGVVPDSNKEQFISKIKDSSLQYTNLLLQKKSFEK